MKIELGKMKNLKLEDFPLITHDKIRYSDTDQQGHVNNAKFLSFLETGRVEIVYCQDCPILSEDCSFVIASVQLDFLNELCWPGQVGIGTGILKIGNSSIHMYQQLVQDGQLVAEAKSVLVQVHNTSKKSYPLSEKSKEILNQALMPGTMKE